MPEVKWTKEQESAILDKGSNILVAAAAGSGKTAVLVERILHKIVDEKVDIDKILVVTFTNAAASEMRQRILDGIYKKIEENPEERFLQKQITLLNKASICTIHSFCLEIIKNYFYELEGFSANFRIGDTAEIELLKQDTLEEMLEKKYEAQEEDLIRLVDTYTNYRGDEPLKEIILKVYEYIQSLPFPQKALKEAVEKLEGTHLEEDFSETIWGEILLGKLQEVLEEGKIKLKAVKEQLAWYGGMEKFEIVIEQDKNMLEKISNVIQTEQKRKWDSVYEIVHQMSYAKWPIDKKVTTEYKQEAKKIRDEVKTSVSKVVEQYFIYSSKEAREDLAYMYPILKSLEKEVLDFAENFAQRKKEKNMIDFHDIEHFALQILWKEQEDGSLERTEISKKLQEKFTEIAIDEYQDSNLVQEFILTSVSNGNNIFMVGDVKQSIYRFRGAKPELFMEKYNQYGAKGENAIGEKIQLFKNFRSRKNILEVTNTIFENIMSKKLGEMDYTKEEFLNYGADYPEQEEKTVAGKAELYVIDTKLPEDNQEEDPQEDEVQEIIENTAIEAKFVAKKIKEMIQSGKQVYDKKEGNRAITYKDIVILLRATTNRAPIYEKELEEQDIPVFSDSSAQYLESTEIQTMLNLLKVIDNPMQDIPLVCILRSPIGNFSDNDLVEIRLVDRKSSFYEAFIKARISAKEALREKIDCFLEQLEEWKKEQKEKSLEEFIWQLYRETGYYHYVGLLNNGALKQANLRMLFEKAKQYESASFQGLFHFIQFMEKVKNSSKDMSAAKIIGENENVVRIMSIHKSKGLEFPVVFLCGTEKHFNMRDLNEPILFHETLGIGPKCIDTEKRITYNTLAKEAISLQAREEAIAEEMRVLYVALTRAKEKLILTGVCKEVEKKLEEKEALLSMYKGKGIHPSILRKYISYLDWIELVILKQKEQAKEWIQVQVIPYERQEEKKEEIYSPKEELLKRLQSITKKEEILEEIKNCWQWEYPYKGALQIPTKTSVTKIKEMLQERKQGGNVLIEQKAEEEKEEQKLGETLGIEYEKREYVVPIFAKPITKITNAQKGTLVHLCIEKMKVEKEYTQETIEQLLEELMQKEIITEQEREEILIQPLLQYVQSDLWKELKQAQEIHKEQPFYIQVPAEEIYEGTSKEDKILVQGIMDLYYISSKGELVLVDYKTDYVEKGQEIKLWEKYKEQLKLYQIALEKALHRKVDKVEIYSTYLGKIVLFEL